MTEETKPGWGTEVGRALAVLIPALLAAAGGYLAGGGSEREREKDNKETPQTLVPTDLMRENATLKKDLGSVNEQLEAARTKIATLPSDALINVDDTPTVVGVDRDQCEKKLEDHMNSKSLSFDKYEPGLFQVKSSTLGSYIYCQKNGSVTFFVIGNDSDQITNKMAVLKTSVDTAFDIE